MSVTILLADDHRILREGLKSLLASEPDFVVVGEASDGTEAMRLVNRLRPDVVVMDLMMPGINGLEATRQIHAETRVIILSMHANEAYVREALRSGARGYVLKESTSSELVEAVREVAAGGRYLSPAISESMVEMYMSLSSAGDIDVYETLTSREREVFLLVAQGKSNQEISQILSLSIRTVEVHRANMMRKMGLTSQVELVRQAIKRGLVPLDD